MPRANSVASLLVRSATNCFCEVKREVSRITSTTITHDANSHVRIGHHVPCSKLLTKVYDFKSERVLVDALYRSLALTDILLTHLPYTHSHEFSYGPYFTLGENLRLVCFRALVSYSSYEILGWVKMVQDAKSFVGWSPRHYKLIALIACLTCATKLVNDNAPYTRDLTDSWGIDFEALVSMEYRLIDYMYGASGVSMHIDMCAEEVTEFKLRLQKREKEQSSYENGTP